MHWWMIAGVVVGLAGCGATSTLELARVHRSWEGSSWDTRASSATHRFPAPVTSLALGRDGGCAQLEDDTVECWGVGTIGAVRAMRAPHRARLRATHPIESITFGDHPCAWSVGGGARCARYRGGWTTIPAEPEPGEDTTTGTYSILRSELATSVCEIAGQDITCTFPLPEGDVVCLDGGESVPCSEVDPRSPVRVRASAAVVEATIENAVLCAALIDQRFECWHVFGRRFLTEREEDEDRPPVPLGELVGTSSPAVGHGRACAIHRDDARLVTCVGFGPLGAESFAGAVGLPNDPWTRVFLGVGRPATSNEPAFHPDSPALCAGRSVSHDLGPYTCVLRAEAGGSKETGLVRHVWADLVPEGTTRLSFDGANFCTLGGDHALTCRAEPGREVRLSGVHEHVAGPGTLYWIDRDGVAWCAGNNIDVQCRDDGPRDVRTPHRIAIPRAAHLAAGDTHACAVTTDGAVWCWGRNTDLQVTGTALLDASGALAASDEAIERFLLDAPEYTSPTEVLPPGSAVDVACGAYTTCVARADGSSFCW